MGIQFPPAQPKDFNDWGNDPFGADKAAALSLNLNWKKIWEVPKVPLGTAELWQFGPNGPPMNVMDTCPVSNMLWIANQYLGFFKIQFKTVVFFACWPSKLMRNIISRN